MDTLKTSSAISTAGLTALTMVAFAANSVLCRQALGEGIIDAASFASVRMTAGAVMLQLLVMLRQRPNEPCPINWGTVLMLFSYMAFFSFAYLSLAAGTGALILFGAVQLTMFSAALRAGEHFSKLSWAGLGLAVFGLIYLVSPGLAAPDPLSALMMAIAGVSWGFYSLFGRGTRDPLRATAQNFTYSLPLVFAISLLFWSDMALSPKGVLLAVASGALASGCGYALWYKVLPLLSAARAATVQLSVPAIAALGGVIILSEELTLRLGLASFATLIGVAIVLSQRAKKT